MLVWNLKQNKEYNICYDYESNWLYKESNHRIVVYKRRTRWNYNKLEASCKTFFRFDDSNLDALTTKNNLITKEFLACGDNKAIKVN